MVRSAKEIDAVVAANPFPGEAKSDPGHLVVMFLKDKVAAKDVAALQESVFNSRFSLLSTINTRPYRKGYTQKLP